MKRLDRLHRLLPWMIAALLAAALWSPGALAASVTADTAAKLVDQVNQALRHAGFALTAGNDQGFRTHTHHVVNILGGEKGMGFDAAFGNPGDGYGALEYARDLRADADVMAAGWEGTAQTVALWLEKAAQEALLAARAADSGQTGTGRMHLTTALAFLSAAKGREGEEAPVAGALSLQAGLAAAGPAKEESDSGGGYY